MFVKRTNWPSHCDAQTGGHCRLRPGRGASVDLGMPRSDLMKIESRQLPQGARCSTAAAVYVITAEDIRRSGLTSVPELLRLAPGVQVAQINGSKWAVSVRGFNGLYSNKLLVLIDGRTVYNPIFAGVTWDSEDLMVENIDQIEIVRGPGGAVWGANAVNGVIKVVTKKAAHRNTGNVRACGRGDARSTSSPCGTATANVGGTIAPTPNGLNVARPIFRRGCRRRTMRMGSLLARAPTEPARTRPG